MIMMLLLLVVFVLAFSVEMPKIHDAAPNFTEAAVGHGPTHGVHHVAHLKMIRIYQTGFKKTSKLPVNFSSKNPKRSCFCVSPKRSCSVRLGSAPAAISSEGGVGRCGELQTPGAVQRACSAVARAEPRCFQRFWGGLAMNQLGD